MIIAAWPGTGKTWAANNIRDLTDIEPDTAPTGISHQPLPESLIDATLTAHQDGQTVLITLHPETLRALQERGAVVAAIAPEHGDRINYLARCRARGKTAAYVEYLNQHWNRDMEAIADMPVVRLAPGQHVMDLLPAGDGALIGEIMIGNDQRFHAVSDGIIWTATRHGITPSAQVHIATPYMQGLDRSWPGLAATNGRDTVLASTDLTVRPTRADQVRAGDIVRWMGTTRLVKHVTQIDEETVGLRFWAAGYDVPLYAAHPVDVIVISRPAPVSAPRCQLGQLTEAELDALPIGAKVIADGQVWERLPTTDGALWAGLWATQDLEVYGWGLTRHRSPVTLLSPIQ